MEKRRLIVLDDEPDFAAFVRMVAEGLGFDVTVLTDPLLFKDSFETVDPAIVVLDIIMPEMDGIEVVQWLLARQAPVSVLLVTAYNPRYAKMAEILSRDRGLTKVQTLEKPVSVAQLRAALAAA